MNQQIVRELQTNVVLREQVFNWSQELFGQYSLYALVDESGLTRLSIVKPWEVRSFREYCERKGYDYQFLTRSCIRNYDELDAILSFIITTKDD